MRATVSFSRRWCPVVTCLDKLETSPGRERDFITILSDSLSEPGGSEDLGAVKCSDVIADHC